MELKYNNGIFIGRFQPLHNGHINIIEKMIEDYYDKKLNNIIICICDTPQPLNYEERIEMFKLYFKQDFITYIFMPTFNNCDIWYDELIKRLYNVTKGNLIFYGHQKDVDKRKYTFRNIKYTGHYYGIFELMKHGVVYLSNYKNINARDLKCCRKNAKLNTPEQIYIFLIKHNFFDKKI